MPKRTATLALTAAAVTMIGTSASAGAREVVRLYEVPIVKGTAGSV